VCIHNIIPIVFSVKIKLDNVAHSIIIIIAAMATRDELVSQGEPKSVPPHLTPQNMIWSWQLSLTNIVFRILGEVGAILKATQLSF
jgi:hypothetical protein